MSRRDGKEGHVTWLLTICHDKEVDTEDCEAFAESVGCVLELPLHDCGVDLDENYAG